MNRLSGFSPFYVMEILERSKSLKRDVIHLEIGEPDLSPPPKVLEALKELSKRKNFPYTHSLGLYELRERISLHYKEYYGVEVEPERIVITTGSSGAFLVAYASVMDFGDRLLLPEPTYPCYKNFAKLLGIDVVSLKTYPEDDYKIDLKKVKNLKVKAIHITSPSNPTGSLYDASSLRELVEFCQREGIYLISDEVYHGLTYTQERERSALEFSQEVIVINSFSKFFCMPGFRVGWMVLPKELLRKAQIILQNLFISAPVISQYCALYSFDYQYLKKVRETFKRRWEFALNYTKDFLKVCGNPRGAFYLWVDLSQYTNDSLNFCNRLLEEKGVALTPGIDFGNYKNFVRISFAKDLEELREGLRRLKEFLEEF